MFLFFEFQNAFSSSPQRSTLNAQRWILFFVSTLNAQRWIFFFVSTLNAQRYFISFPYVHH
jgi:hypothetical protein